jgi:hypothetical protein
MTSLTYQVIHETVFFYDGRVTTATDIFIARRIRVDTIDMLLADIAVQPITCLLHPVPVRKYQIQLFQHRQLQTTQEFADFPIDNDDKLLEFRPADIRQYAGSVTLKRVNRQNCSAQVLKVDKKLPCCATLGGSKVGDRGLQHEMLNRVWKRAP